jgi:hypothetical protein
MREQEKHQGDLTLFAFAGVVIVVYLMGCGLLYLLFRGVNG